MSRGKMKLSSEERLAFVERALKNEASINSLAKEAQVSFSTIERWIILYENEGPQVYSLQKGINHTQQS
ncbi:helix-turn-helix domain-containing protein [Enterococcus casseliflavus]|uniref:helix-turn-helix domain-containing protein n=1 Tax=Enterococcus casseliflavus TaxID=37734 RepID=UPI001C8C533E|nr:helix-turn-helix domain-containing protein [Enterococcus casseliflavus]